ncbi:MAG: hypothetical protein JOY85_23590 [Acidobacteriaceae bacterium]|nr:hypothetical protein [Acidobacteriaceae bacterium]
MTALLLALIEFKFGIALYSFMWWFVIPVGALLAGFAAASGYYFGAKTFHHRPTRLLVFNMISVAVTTYFVINYLNYSLLQIDGHPASSLVSFGQYMDVLLSHQSLALRIRGAKVGETGDLGAFGYIVALLQILGFAVGGLAVYGNLRSNPYCGKCNKYLKVISSIMRHASDAEQIQRVYNRVLTELQNGNSLQAVSSLAEFGTKASIPSTMPLRAEVTLYRCVCCPQEFVKASLCTHNGRDWNSVPESEVRFFLPASVQS